MHTNQFHLLKSRRFLPLFVAQFLGAFNDNVFRSSLAILITYRIAIHGFFEPELLVAISAALFMIPSFLFSATAGILADKFERTKLLTVFKFLEIPIVFLAIYSFRSHNLSQLSVLLVLLGLQCALFGPVKYAILPDLLEEDELVAGNGLIEASTFIAILFGTIVGGTVVMSYHGEQHLTTIMVTTAVLSFIASLFIPKAAYGDANLKISTNFVRETQEVISYVKNHWDVYLIILGISWFWLMGATFLTELSTYTRNILGANEHVYCFFFSIFSIGLALGSMLCNKLLKGKIHGTYIPLGALGMTIFMADIYFASPSAAATNTAHLIGVNDFLQHWQNWRIAFDLFSAALCAGLYTVPLYAMMVYRSNPQHRARVIAANNIYNALFMVVSSLIVMLLLKMGFSVTHIFLFMAIANAVVAIHVCKLLPEATLKSFAKWILQLVYRVEINGLEHYYSAGDRIIIVANHTSFLDGALLAAFIPEKLTFAINTYSARQWWIRMFLGFVDAYPLDPLNPMQIKSLIEYLENNKKCAIFPEGRITVTGSLMKIYEGPALIADKAGAKLLPLCIEGAQYSTFSRLRGKLNLKWFPKITMTIFPPCEFNVPDTCKGRARRQLMSTMLYDLMTNMVFNSRDRDQTIISTLLNAKKIHGRNHIIAEDIERKPMTFQQLITRSYILGNLIKKATHKQEFVGVLLPNSLTTIVTFYAMQFYGRVPAMINYTSGVKNILSSCHAAAIKRIYTSRLFVERANLHHIIDALQTARLEVIFLEDLRQEIGFFRKLKGMFMAQFPRYFYEKVSRPSVFSNVPTIHSPAVILFTSGSEGTPKGVVLSHANIQANRYQLIARLDFMPTDIVFNALPLFHSFGLMGGMLLPIISGIRVFFYPSPLHYRIVPELTYDTNSTIIFGTDTFLGNYAKCAHPYDFFSLRYVFAGAEKLKDETRLMWAEKFGVRILEGYGATEAAPGIAINTPMQYRLNTVGRLLPGIEYRLNEIPGINSGYELVIKGPNIMLGYLRPDQPGQIQPPPDGWYETGDVVAFDHEGYLSIIGRVKRFAKIGGEMVSLPAVENYINQIWPKYQNAVISMACERKGEQIVLVTNNPEARRDVIVNYARLQGISEISIPRKIKFLSELPLLGSGKIDYVTAKEIVEQDINQFDIEMPEHELEYE